jgi:hypothetical protein
MSSFTRHYHSYKYITAAFVIFLFAFAIIYNIVAGFLSSGIPVGMVILDSGEPSSAVSSLLWVIMHFMMLSLIFIVIVLVAYAWDTKREPRAMIKHPVINRDEVLEKRKKEARLKLHKTFKRGFSRHHIHEHLLEKGYTDSEIHEALERHRIR